MKYLAPLVMVTPTLMPDWMDPEYLIMALGNWALWGVALIVFAECGLFALLPGDSLLFTVGMFVALGTIKFGDMDPFGVLMIACAVLTVAAILGNMSGYYIGHLIGPPLFREREGIMGKVFDPKHIDKTHAFFEKYGNRALILGRFVPFVRTFITLVAGVSKMSFRRFIEYTAIGGVIWVYLLTLLGYFLGTVPFVHDNIEIAILLIVFVSLLPMIVEIWRAKRQKKKEATAAVVANVLSADEADATVDGDIAETIDAEIAAEAGALADNPNVALVAASPAESATTPEPPGAN